MNRNFFIIVSIGILLIFLCITIDASAVMYPYYDPNVTIAVNCTQGTRSETINQGDNVLQGSCADVIIVRGFYNKIVHESGSPIIDVSAFPRRILINPEIWKVGVYYMWASYEELNANNWAFTVVTNVTTPEEIVVMTVNESVTNKTALIGIKYQYKLEERVVGDVLLARGDPLSFNNSVITNQSRAWLFGTYDGLYDLPCNNTQLFVDADKMGEMRPGLYYLVIDNPGTNTIAEAVWDEEHELVTSPIRKTPDLDIAGYSPRVVYDKIVPWLWKYSDDQVSVFKLEVQEPYIEITGVSTAYSGMTDVLQVDGYTNLAINSSVYAAIDEDNRSMDILRAPREYDLVMGDIEKQGTMREFRIDFPFDFQNKTPGQHHAMVHGPFNTYAVVGVPIGLLPEGQERPKEYIRYINSTIWNPTPTPEIREVVVTKTVQVVERMTVPVPPSDEQLTKTQFLAMVQFAQMAVQYVILGGVGVYLLYVVFRVVVNRIVKR